MNLLPESETPEPPEAPDPSEIRQPHDDPPRPTDPDELEEPRDPPDPEVRDPPDDDEPEGRTGAARNAINSSAWRPV